MATLATMRDFVAKELGLQNDTNGDQTMIDARLNQGVLEVLLRTHCTVEAGSMSTSADVWEYQLDTTILAIDNLWKEDSDGSLDLCVREQTVDLFSLKRATGTSYDANIVHYAVRGANLLIVWPTPSSAYTLKLHYVPRPTAMSSGSHDPSNVTYGRVPAEFHDLIELWAMHRLASYDDDQSSQQGERYRALFEQGIKEMRKAIHHKGGTRLAPVRVKPRGRIVVPSDPAIPAY